MAWNVVLGSIQAAPDIAAGLERIAWAQWVTAIGTVLVALVAVGLAVAVYVSLRALARRAEAMERMLARLEPRVEPLLDRAGKIAEDASHVSHALREEVARARELLEDVNERLRAGVDDAEDRLRRFGAVLRVVQREAENLLLEGAAAARGVHVAAERLRGAGSRRRRRTYVGELDFEADDVEAEPPPVRRRSPAPEED
ncbi:MAG TPA: hypothetical protein VIL18_14840 [Longimicrobiales bacterium]